MGSIPQVQVQETVPEPPPQMFHRVEQLVLQVEIIIQVYPPPPANIEVQDIESDLVEEISPSTYVFLVTIPSILPPTFSTT